VPSISVLTDGDIPPRGGFSVLEIFRRSPERAYVRQARVRHQRRRHRGAYRASTRILFVVVVTVAAFDGARADVHRWRDILKLNSLWRWLCRQTRDVEKLSKGLAEFCDASTLALDYSRGRRRGRVGADRGAVAWLSVMTENNTKIRLSIVWYQTTGSILARRELVGARGRQTRTIREISRATPSSAAVAPRFATIDRPLANVAKLNRKTALCPR
jgi:hypothetical protein